MAVEPGSGDAADGALDGVFHALANPHRREIVRILGQQPAAIHQLAALRGLSLPAINKHLAILDEAGFIKRHKRGRTTFLTLDPGPISDLQQWASQFHTYWGTGDGTFENFEQYLSRPPADTRDSGRRRRRP